MALEISTAGLSIGYAVETTAGTRPTASYTVIPQVKSIPAFGSDVNALQTTPLSATVNHTYIPGLRDSGGSIGLTVNDCPTFRTAWSGLITAFTTAKAAGKATWFEIKYPTGAGAMDSIFFSGEPAELGFGGAEVDAVLENTANIMPTSDFTWATAST